MFKRGKNRSRFSGITCFLSLILLTFTLTGCGRIMHPYDTTSSCPPTYMGVCESMQQAYKDSVTNIDPRMFDNKWIKRRIEFEKKHKELYEARKAAGQDVELLTDLVEGKGENVRKKDEVYTYRYRLLHEMRKVLEKPAKPVLIPPQVVRALIAPTETPDEYGTALVSATYIYVILDKPRWIYSQIPEPEVAHPANPMVRVKVKGKKREFVRKVMGKKPEIKIKQVSEGK